MFTGIIEEIGKVVSLNRSSQTGKLTIAVSKDFSPIKTGESIAVNGACLTVTSVKRNNIEFDLSFETLQKTTLHMLKPEDKVNLERALPIAGRLGGHLVSGHVDGIGEIRQKISQSKGLELHISVPSQILPFMVSKGSITLDGISLTIADIRKSLLVIYVVPHTAKVTTLSQKNIGDQVNIEVDLLSKYIERHLRQEVNKGITEDTLTRAGFLPMGWIEN